MKTLRALLLLLLPAAAPAVGFTLPFVDITPNLAGGSTMMAVWSSSPQFVTAGTTVGVQFSNSVTLSASLNPATCQCIFLRHTSTSAGAWAASEITVTAGTYDRAVDDHYIGLSLPASLYPGKFYIRFDTSAGMKLDANSGMATLAVTDPWGNSTVSRGFYIAESVSAAPVLGTVSGVVSDSTGKALVGALVSASSYGSYLPTALSPRGGYIDPLTTDQDVFSAATGGDGSYTLSLPPGNYSFQAEVWEHKDGICNSVTAVSPTNVTFGSAGGSVTLPISLPALP